MPLSTTKLLKTDSELAVTMELASLNYYFHFHFNTRGKDINPFIHHQTKS